MSHVLRIGSPDQIAYFRVFNDDGSAKTDFSSATAGASLSVFRIGLSPISIAVLSNKAADNTSHADGAIRSVGGNLYTVDLPDSAAASYCPSIGVRGSFTGGVIEPIPHPLVGYDPAQAAVGANTVVPATGDQLDAAVNTINNYTLTNVIAVNTYQNALDAKNAINSLGSRIPAALVSGKMSSYIDPADRSGYSLAADQPVNVTKVGGTTVSGPADLKADVSGLSTFNAATDAVSLQPDQGVNIVKVAGATAIASDSTVNFPLAIGTSFLSPVNVGQVLVDYGVSRTSEVNAIPAAVWSHTSRTLSAFGFSVTVGANQDKTGYALAADQPVNVTKVGGTAVAGPNDLKANVSGLITQAYFEDWYISTALPADNNLIINLYSQILTRTLPTASYATAAGVSDIQGRLPAALVGGRIDAYVGASGISLGGGATPAEIWSHDERTLTSASAEVEVDTAALAAAIAEQLTSTGEYRLTVTVLNAEAESVPGVTLQILGVAGTTRTTGTDGPSLIDLNPGEYSLRVSVPAGYEPVADRVIEIVDEDVTESIELVSVTITASADPSVCSVAVDLVTQGGIRPIDVPVWALPVEAGGTSGDSWVVNDDDTYPTNSQGRALVPILRGLRVRIYCNFGDKTYSRVFDVPDEPTAIATLNLA